MVHARCSSAALKWGFCFCCFPVLFILPIPVLWGTCISTAMLVFNTSSSHTKWISPKCCTIFLFSQKHACDFSCSTPQRVITFIKLSRRRNLIGMDVFYLRLLQHVVCNILSFRRFASLHYAETWVGCICVKRAHLQKILFFFLSTCRLNLE